MSHGAVFLSLELICLNLASVLLGRAIETLIPIEHILFALKHDVQRDLKFCTSCAFSFAIFLKKHQIKLHIGCIYVEMWISVNSTCSEL